MSSQPTIATPWAIRTIKHDDWGWIRDANGDLACIARGHDEKDGDQHRRDGTDPYAANAALIVEAVNSYAALKARVAEMEEALKPFAEIAKELQPHLAAEYKNTMHWAVPTVGQLRAAAAALQRKTGS